MAFGRYILMAGMEGRDGGSEGGVEGCRDGESGYVGEGRKGSERRVGKEGR